MTSGYTIFPLGDCALTIEFGHVIDKEVNKRVLALFRQLKSLPLPGITDVVPAYGSLSVYYDTVAILQEAEEDKTAFETMSEAMRQLLEGEHLSAIDVSPRHIRVPVCYAPRYAPDLEMLANARELTTEEVVHLHTTGVYRVYMLGFLPGFAYMGEVDERIAMPRKDTPQWVAAGGVGIAGRQTGIYPLGSPGGWQIIGRTPLKLFHRKDEHPVLFSPGDTVTFYSITEDEFAHY
ncbi:MAG TPA: 5-oxoprolinase subunit PxpB [Chitinophagaceae bacterium]